MNLPNRLTMARVAMIPAIVGLMMAGGKLWGLMALGLFIAASITDFFDGRIARRDGLITDFGKFMDPIADKLLVTAVMIMLTECGVLPGWMLVIFVAREFMISGLRLVAAGKGHVLAAGRLGKIKTATQMVALIITMALYYSMGGMTPETYAISMALLGVALFFSVWSGIDYMYRNWDMISDM